MERFRVRDAGHLTDPDLGVEVLVLAENAEGLGGRRLEIQRSLVHDEQDRQLGLDNHGVVSDTGASAYAAIREWELDGERLRILVTSPAAELLGIDEGYELTLEPDLVDRAMVRLALESVVGTALGGVWRTE